MTTTGYLNSRHAAEYLDMTLDAFDQAVRRHGIPHVKIGQHRRFTREALDAMLVAMALRPKARRKRVA